MNLQNPIWPPYFESISFNTSSRFKAIAFKFCTQCYIHKRFKPAKFDIALSNDAESTEVFPEIVLDVQDTSHFLESEEESSIAREIDPFSDVKSIITDVGADSDEEIFNMTQQRINDYFPFPSEIFFLLYSYTHNISRPKVFLRCYIIIYGNKI